MNYGVYSIFQAFGYTPSEEEVDQFAGTFAGNGGDVRGRASVAAYVNAAKKQQEFNKNNPINNVIADEKGFFTDTERRAAESATAATSEQARAEKTLTDAPKLFGSLTQDQISQYLSPLNQAAADSGARLEGAAGRRGLVGSSTEANALAENERKFKENVLATGLQVGQQQQTSLANLIAQHVAQLNGNSQNFYGQLPGLLNAQGSLATHLSDQQNENSRYLSELPTYLRSVANTERMTQESIDAAERARRNARNGSFGSIVGSVLGGGAGLFLGGPMGAGVGASLGGNLGRGIADPTSGYNPGNDALALSMLYRSPGGTSGPAPMASQPLFRGGNSYAGSPSDYYA